MTQYFDKRGNEIVVGGYVAFGVGSHTTATYYGIVEEIIECKPFVSPSPYAAWLKPDDTDWGFRIKIKQEGYNNSSSLKKVSEVLVIPSPGTLKGKIEKDSC